MSESVRCWLVDRSVDDGRIITVTYATEDGSATTSRQHAVGSADDVPVAIEADPDGLSAVDEADRDRFRSEVDRMQDEHAPSDRV